MRYSSSESEHGMISLIISIVAAITSDLIEGTFDFISRHSPCIHSDRFPGGWYDARL